MRANDTTLDTTIIQTAPEHDVLLTPDPYPHFTIKECLEQPEAIARVRTRCCLVLTSPAIVHTISLTLCQHLIALTLISFPAIPFLSSSYRLRL